MLDHQTLSQLGVQQDDIIEARRISEQQQQENSAASSASSGSMEIPSSLLQNPAALQQFIRSQPQLLEQLRQINPPLAQAVMNDDISQLATYMEQQERARRELADREAERIRLANADPFDLEAQAKVTHNIT